MTQEYNGTQDLEEYQVVKFYADWCGPCKVYAPIFDELADLDESMKYLSVNVDEHPDVARDFNVRAIPTVAVEGEKVKDHIAWTQERLQAVV